MTIQDIFIGNLKNYRKLRKLSQLKLAENCNSSQTYIAEIEVGKKFPSLDMIEKIAAALEIESYYLFQNTPLKTDIVTLTELRLAPSQKREIIGKIQGAVAKIIEGY
jgi:transcriptional regulator with XRE-family HTH domain